MKELTYVKKGFIAAAIALVIISFAEFNTLFVLVTVNLPAYAQRPENTTKLNITSSMADAPSRPFEKQFPPDQDSITVTPGLSTDELNTDTQQDSADIGENELQGKIPELQPEALDQQRSEQRDNDLVAKPTLDVETASENLDEKQDETARNFATQNEDSEDSEQEDRQRTEEQRDESRSEGNEAQGNNADLEEQNEQGKEDGDEGDGDEDKDNRNKDDNDGDEDKDEGDDKNEIPFELPFP